MYHSVRHIGAESRAFGFRFSTSISPFTSLSYELFMASACRASTRGIFQRDAAHYLFWPPWPRRICQRQWSFSASARPHWFCLNRIDFSAAKAPLQPAVRSTYCRSSLAPRMVWSGEERVDHINRLELKINGELQPPRNIRFVGFGEFWKGRALCTIELIQSYDICMVEKIK